MLLSLNLWLVAALFLCASSGILHGEVADLDEARALSDRVMHQIGAGDYKGAFDAVAEHFSEPKEEVEELRSKTEEQLTAAAPRFGKLIGSEFVGVQFAGSSLVRYVFLQKFEKHAVRWMIIYYRPVKNWVVNGFGFDDQVARLFE